MAVFIKIPLQLYLGFLGRCLLSSREYAVLKTSIIERSAERQFSVDVVDILCETSDAQLILERALQFYVEAVPFIRDGLTFYEAPITASEYRMKSTGDTWHFCASCSKWPIESYRSTPELPARQTICNECIEKNQQSV